MPTIEFRGELIRKGVMSSCIVKTKMGNTDPVVKECIDLVKKFFEHGIVKLLGAKLVYIVHGYKGNVEKPWLKDLTNNLMERYKNHRIVVGIVSWEEGAKLLYPSPTAVHYPVAAVNTWPVGNVLAYVTDNLAKNVPEKKISAICIGHSLGAHLCGFFGKMLKKLKPTIRLDKIIGLDPAGPIFENAQQDPNLRLEKNDATHTEIIHTNTKRYGFTKPIGHADIFVNGGSKQPACPTISLNVQCSHRYGYHFMVELAKPPQGGMQCTAHWKCDSKEYQKLAAVTKEDKTRLKDAGCVMQQPNKVLRIGDLDIKGNMKEGVFWVEASKESETCKFPTTKR